MWRGCGWPEPLKERGVAEKVEVNGVRMVGQVHSGGSSRFRQRVPVARAARHRAKIHEAQRIEPRHTQIDARVPDHQDTKQGE